MIKTKIVATVGPACDKADVIGNMIESGVSVFRLNFSHGTLDDHARFLHALNAARAGHSETVAVMGDLCGPKIRTAVIRPEGYVLNAGDEITITDETSDGTPARFGTNYPPFVADVAAGQRVFIDDGAIALRVIDKRPGEIVCRVLAGGPLYSRKGINLPDTDLSTASITDRDWECVDWAIEQKLEFLALSFVRTADEIRLLKDYIAKAGSDIKVVAKIEKPQAIDHLEAIVRASDVVLVARGDLGVEMDLAEVPLIQKRITRLCGRFGVPVIVATQMLQSMIEVPSPTRAEVSDVANAIMDFTDAVMLSGETAIGKYPIESVKAMGRIAHVTEAWLDSLDELRPKIETNDDLAAAAAMARTIAHLVDDIAPRLVATWSETGEAARLLSKARIDVPILALSSSERVCRQMCLHHGVVPRQASVCDGLEEFTALAQRLAIENRLAHRSDKIVMVAGSPIGRSETATAIMVHTVTAP